MNRYEVKPVTETALEYATEKFRTSRDTATAIVAEKGFIAGAKYIIRLIQQELIDEETGNDYSETYQYEIKHLINKLNGETFNDRNN